MELLLDGQPLGEAAAIDEWRAAELACLPPDGAALRLWLGDAELEPFLRPGDPAWRWRVAAQGSAGSFPIVLRAAWPDGRSDELRARLRVRPRKLDEQRYRLLLDDLQRLGRALVFALAGGAEPGAWEGAPADGAPAPAEELAGLLGPEAERFLAAAERIARRPADRLRPELRMVEPGQARDLAAIDRARLDDSAAYLPAEYPPAGEANAQRSLPQQESSPPPMAGEGAGARGLPDLARHLAAIPERQPAPSHDTAENRLLKRVAAALARRLRLLQGAPGLPESARERIAAALGRLRGLLARPLFAEVGALSQLAGPTPRTQRDPDYRAVYRMWQLLRRRPLIGWDAATLSIATQDLPRLYERWCAARVALDLLGLPGLRIAGQGLAAQDPEDDHAWALALAEGGPLLELDAPDGLRLTLRYQARYTPGGAPLRSLDRHTRVPDLAIELARPDHPPRVIVLDAKYRLDAAGGVPEDALADAYSYLSAIGTADGARAALAVALLYPGRGSAEAYPSGAAALPLLPGDEGELGAWLEGAINP